MYQRKQEQKANPGRSRLAQDTSHLPRACKNREIQNGQMGERTKR
jgi:hypothetical protein